MNTATQIIAQHLGNKKMLPVKNLGDGIVCAFSGRSISEGVRLKDVLSGNFTDHDCLAYNSNYCAVDVAQCMKPLSEEGRASLRNYSFLATNEGLKFLGMKDLAPAVLEPKPLPFVLAISYNQKKHIAYKAMPQYSNEEFTVYTDQGPVDVNAATAHAIMTVAQKWYGVIQGKESTAAQPTYFTKDEIYKGDIPHAKQRRYIAAHSPSDFFREQKVLETYFHTPVLALLTRALAKPGKTETQ